MEKFEIDSDILPLSLKEINKIGTLVAEHAISLDKSYILDISIKRCDGTISIAACSSEQKCYIYGLRNEQLYQINSYQCHSDVITGIKFSTNSANEIYTSSTDGTVKLWDIRSNKSVRQFQSDKVIKPITCFDLAEDEKLLCAGTELVNDDSFILFWDTRTCKILGGYWNSHSDDITKVCEILGGYWNSHSDDITKVCEILRKLSGNQIQMCATARAYLSNAQSVHLTLLNSSLKY